MQEIASAVLRIASSGVPFKTPSNAIVNSVPKSEDSFNGITLRVEQPCGGLSTFTFCREGNFSTECFPLLSEEAKALLLELPAASEHKRQIVEEPRFIPREQVPAHYQPCKN